MAKVGDTICIDYMSGEPHYTGRTGIVKSVDGIGQLHGTWGGLAVVPGEDSYHIIKKCEDNTGE